MGIYDREYYRREGPSFLGSITQHGRVCKWLIAINVIVFVLQLVTEPRQAHQAVFDEDGIPVLIAAPAGASVTDMFLLDTKKVLDGQIWRLLTYAFLHSPYTPWHILFNMLILWWFGTDVEDLYGSREFLTFYLVAAVLSGIAYQLTWMAGVLEGQRALGASGAVTAVLVLFALHYPRHIIYFFLIPMPVWLFVLIQVGQDFFGFVTGHTRGVGVAAHLGGAAFAFLYYKTQLRLLNLLPDFKNLRRFRSRPRLRVYREESRQPVAVGASPAGDSDEQLEAKLDAVLEKVARSGQSSLTESERKILMQASEIYKRRRS